MTKHETSAQRPMLKNCLPATIAFIATYCVYYLRHPSTIRDFSAAGGSVAIGGAVLIFLALISGLLANAMKPRTTVKAFTIGFALPAVFFASDIKEVSTQTQKASILSIAPLFQKTDSRPNAFSTALALVLAPVTSVSESNTASAVREEAAMRGKVETELALARAEMENTKIQIQTLSVNRNDAEAALVRLASESQANRDQYLKASEELTYLKESTTNVKALRDSISAALAKTPDALERLQHECRRRVERWQDLEPFFTQIVTQISEARRLVAK